MSAVASAVMGCQTPRISTFPKAKWNDADDCAFLAEAYGLKPDPWQMNVLQAWMGRSANNRWAAGRWGIAVPRQNGKNGVLEMVELFFMVELGLKILHTAHEVKTARKAFLRILSFFENERLYPELAAMVKEIRKTNGQEKILLHHRDCDPAKGCNCKETGGSVEFIARSKGSGRGFTVDVLVCDEAQEYGEDAQAALLPTISSAPSGDPLQILLGTPPAPGMDGSVFTRLRNAGVSGKDKRVSWVEWSIDEKAKISDRANWFASNPSLGIRLNLNTVADEYGAMSPEMFARERCGRWDIGAGGSKAFDDAEWNAQKATPPADGVRCFGVKFSADGSHVALGAAMKPGAGLVHVEAIKSAPMADGIQWLVDFLSDDDRKARTAQIVIDGRAGTGYLAQALRDGGVNKRVIWIPTVDQAITAHTTFKQAITDAEITHSGQKDLDEQIKDTTKRKIGTSGGFGWEPITDGKSVAFVDAVTLAFWGARTTKRKPGRRQRI